MKELNKEQIKEIKDLVGLQGYTYLKENLTRALNGEKIIYATDYKPILKKRKEIMRKFQNLAILNRKEEKIFLLIRKKHKKNEK